MLYLIRRSIFLTICLMGLAVASTSGEVVATPLFDQAGSMTAQVPTKPTVMRINVNGQFDSVLLVDTNTNTNGILIVSRDQFANTSALDFSYATPDPANPNLAVFIQGAGEIPNAAFTTTPTTGHLVVTVSSSATFLMNYCVVHLDTASLECFPPPPRSFDLTWVGDGLGSAFETATLVETFGPLTTKSEGTFTSKTAKVNGTWDAHSPVNMPGTLENTRNTNIIREITVSAP